MLMEPQHIQVHDDINEAYNEEDDEEEFNNETLMQENEGVEQQYNQMVPAETSS
jgi:hypothetical protein